MSFTYLIYSYFSLKICIFSNILLIDGCYDKIAVEKSYDILDSFIEQSIKSIEFVKHQYKYQNDDKFESLVIELENHQIGIKTARTWFHNNKYQDDKLKIEDRYTEIIEFEQKILHSNALRFISVFNFSSECKENSIKEEYSIEFSRPCMNEDLIYAKMIPTLNNEYIKELKDDNRRLQLKIDAISKER